MKFVNPIPFVRDIETSKWFYSDVLQLPILRDHGDFVLFTCGFAIHQGDALYRTIFGAPTDERGPFGRRNLVLYFEDDDIRSSFQRIVGHVDLIHGIRKEPWGQSVFRLYDPDLHIVEIGEPQ